MKSYHAAAIALAIPLTAPAQVMAPPRSSSLPLEYLVRQPEGADGPSPVLFLFHGAGSNERDLFSFAARLPDEWLVISARAPYAVAEGHYNWYDVKMAGRDITINFSQEEESRRAVLAFMEEAVSLYQADSRRVVLAGFSQGANMASAVSLTAPGKVAGFAVFSGRFIPEIKPLISTSDSLRSLRCFLAHGSQDSMLPIAYARENRRILESLGIPVMYSEDAVAHTISPKQFEDFLLWLEQF